MQLNKLFTVVTMLVLWMSPLAAHQGSKRVLEVGPGTGAFSRSILPLPAEGADVVLPLLDKYAALIT